MKYRFNLIVLMLISLQLQDLNAQHWEITEKLKACDDNELDYGLFYY